MRQLNRLLAACDVVARVELEPRHAAHDAVLSTALAADRPAALDQLPAVVTTLRRRTGVHPVTCAPTGRVWPPVTWAVDAATACCLQGVLLPISYLEIVLQDDEGGRGWLKRVAARGFDATGYSLAPHWEEPAELARLYLRRPVFTRNGFLQIRLVPALERTVEVTDDDLAMPALSLAEVARAHQQLSELIDRAPTPLAHVPVP